MKSKNKGQLAYHAVSAICLVVSAAIIAYWWVASMQLVLTWWSIGGLATLASGGW